jgi:N-acetylglucosaminyl-diphospho-decaprenol L-rhamnosyltransferase
LIYFLTVNYYSSELIRRLTSSIQQGDHHDHHDYRLVIVNNAVDDAAIALLENEYTTVIHAGDNLGFGRACNLGLNWIYDRDPSATVWIINPDAYVDKDAISQLDSLRQEHKEIAILGTAVYDTLGQLCFSGGKFTPSNGAIWEEKTVSNIGANASISKDIAYRQTDWVSACSMVLNLQHFSGCPYFDPDYFLYYEDFDFCRRYAAQGYVIYFSDRLHVIHQTSSITSRNLDLKIMHEIYSYLVSLEKHASKPVLGYRLIRIAIISSCQMLYRRSQATDKLAGVRMYWQRILKRAVANRYQA